MEPLKKKMQEVPYSDLEGLLDFLPEEQRRIVEPLRELVLECLPGVREKLSFQVPFYQGYSNICFIWPGAVPWGSKTRQGVEFGLVQGHLLSDEAGYLERGQRKQVYSVFFKHPEDIRYELLRSYLYEAAEIDQLLYREKKRR
jgi:hypothetical protein